MIGRDDRWGDDQMDHGPGWNGRPRCRLFIEDPPPGGLGQGLSGSIRERDEEALLRQFSACLLRCLPNVIGLDDEGIGRRRVARRCVGA